VRGSLPHLAVVSGIMLGSFYVSHYTLTTYSRKLKQKGIVQPEDRLPPMIVGAAILPVGLFWFSWTSSPKITPWPQIMSGVPIGAGIQIITLQSLAYLIDIYSINSASAISGVMIVRSLLGGLLPMMAVPLYQKLGVRQPPAYRLSATTD
jgi:DHA1 family multidrug resistance protein-like MFS transporter